MDMFSAHQLDTPRWKLAKLAAFVCFGLACCLLGASLVVSQPTTSAAGQAAPPHATTPAR